MLEFVVGSHLACLMRTKSTICLHLLFASALSSPAKGIKWSEIPFFASVTLEQPATTHLFGIFSVSCFLLRYCLLNDSARNSIFIYFSMHSSDEFLLLHHTHCFVPVSFALFSDFLRCQIQCLDSNNF